MMMMTEMVIMVDGRWRKTIRYLVAVSFEFLFFFGAAAAHPCGMEIAVKRLTISNWFLYHFAFVYRNFQLGSIKWVSGENEKHRPLSSAIIIRLRIDSISRNRNPNPTYDARTRVVQVRSINLIYLLDQNFDICILFAVVKMNRHEEDTRYHIELTYSIYLIFFYDLFFICCLAFIFRVFVLGRWTAKRENWSVSPPMDNLKCGRNASPEDRYVSPSSMSQAARTVTGNVSLRRSIQML